MNKEFRAWDKKEKKFWGDFRIHPQGFVAPVLGLPLDSSWGVLDL